MAIIKMNFLSKELGMQTNITVVLPTFSFDDLILNNKNVYVKGMKYQVLYLLHGTTGDDSDFVNFSNIVRYADEHKMAVVMPCGYNSDYTNFPKGIRYLNFITDELVSVCQTLFPLSDKREDNFIGGLSMGGHGAMKIALMYPERYRACLLMSGVSRRPDTVREMITQKVKQTKDSIAMPDLVSVYDFDNFVDGENDAYMYAKRNVENNLELPEIFLTCGQEDQVVDTVIWSYKYIKSLGYPIHLDIVAGYKHEWDFWDLSLRKALSTWLPIKHSVLHFEE